MTPDNQLKPYRNHAYWRSQLSQLLNRASGDSEASEVNVGKRLQELRLFQGLSLRALAELSGLNVNTLSLIENEKTSPNVSTLQQIADALNMPMTAFFQPMTENKDVVFHKKEERSEINFPQATFEDLGGGISLGEGTPLLMTLNADHVSDPTPISHTGQEFVYCLEGGIIFWVGTEEYVLEPGDSLIFEAHIPHRWENAVEGFSRALLVICPSDISDRRVTQHFVDGETNL
jgi:transcriptional regulator with XRE-family HTH domain